MARLTKIAAPIVPIALALCACGGDSPPASLDGDAGGDGWAPWPPAAGDAGLEVVWSTNGETPNSTSCDELDLESLELILLHPVSDDETYTDPSLSAPCASGSILVAPLAGYQPGRYRFEVVLRHQGGEPFANRPRGEVVLVSGQTVIAADINITQAVSGDGGTDAGNADIEPNVFLER
ncbi:MAG: hypothetical protein R6V85_06950 [Polyangia bacterium]